MDTSSRQQGFTLLEVLVTVIIVAIGLLGVAGLQVAGMRSNHSAYLRTQASIAAYDLVDRMRTDPAAFEGKHFSTAAASSERLFEDWKRALTAIGLRAPEDAALGEVDCSDDAAKGCPAGHCFVAVRWNDSRGEHVALAQSGRDTDALAFSVCVRLAQ
jgi:type IV pilus assembly protein PilV